MGTLDHTSLERIAVHHLLLVGISGTVHLVGEPVARWHRRPQYRRWPGRTSKRFYPRSRPACRRRAVRRASDRSRRKTASAAMSRSSGSYSPSSVDRSLRLPIEGVLVDRRRRCPSVCSAGRESTLQALVAYRARISGRNERVGRNLHPPGRRRAPRRAPAAYTCAAEAAPRSSRTP